MATDAGDGASVVVGDIKTFCGRPFLPLFPSLFLSPPLGQIASSRYALRPPKGEGEERGEIDIYGEGLSPSLLHSIIYILFSADAAAASRVTQSARTVARTWEEGGGGSFTFAFY